MRGALPFDPWLAVASLAAGAGLGLLYFGGLWWTVSRLAGHRRPQLLLALSFVVRTGLALVGFFALARLGGFWPSVLGLAGFIVTRWLLVRRWGLEEEGPARGEGVQRSGGS